MSSKRLYKVTLAGWVVKDEKDSDIKEWTQEAILDAMVGEQLMVNFIDSNDMVVTPTRSDVVPEKRKPGRPPKAGKAEAEKTEDAKAKAIRHATLYGAGDKKLEELEKKWDDIVQEANVDNTDKLLDPDVIQEIDELRETEQVEATLKEYEIDESDEPPLVMDFENDDESTDDDTSDQEMVL